MKRIQIKSNVRYAGGSKYVRIPSDIANALELVDGEQVRIEVLEDKALKIIFG